MRNYNAVTQSLESTVVHEDYLISEKYKGGRLMSSFLYIHHIDESKVNDFVRRDLLCLDMNSIHIIGLSNPELTHLVTPRGFCLLADKFNATHFDKCDRSKRYNVLISQNNLAVFKNVGKMFINTLYIRCKKFDSRNSLDAFISTLPDLVRKHGIKNLMIEIHPEVAAKGYLLETFNPTGLKVTYVLNCEAKTVYPPCLGIRKEYKECGKLVTRFKPISRQLFDKCNQYFYQDDAFIRFSPTELTKDEISYNIVYYYSHTKITDTAKYFDILNMMDYQESLVNK